MKREEFEREVAAALRALAESARDCRAPERVERALLAAFEERPAAAAGPTRLAISAWWGLAAAGLAACVALAVWLGAPARVEAPVSIAAKPAPSGAGCQTCAAVVNRRPGPAGPIDSRPQVWRPAPHGPVVKPRKRREVTTRFYPLQYTDIAADLAKGPIVRVEVPRTALGAFGLPYDQDRADPVQADVALDTETGMARAIRFVRAEN